MITYRSIKQSAFQMFPSITNRIRAVKNLVVDVSFRPRVERHVFAGHMLSVAIEDWIGKQWYGQDSGPPTEFALLSGRGLNMGGLVFDLGAHQGVVAMMLANEIGPGGNVIAVEASRRNAELAERNAAMNGMSNITVHHAAVVYQDGPVLFTQRGNGAVALSEKEFRAQTVSGLSIDTLTKTHGIPDLVYMDIEGFEVEALKGASETLKSSASWVIEVHGDDVIGQFGSCNRDVLTFFENGYDLFTASDNYTDEFLPFTGEVPTERFFLAAVPHARRQ